MQLFGIVLIFVGVVLFFWSMRALKRRKNAKAIRQHFFHNFPDALMQVPKNQVRDGIQGSIPLPIQPAPMTHHEVSDTPNRLEPTFTTAAAHSEPIFNEASTSVGEEGLANDPLSAETEEKNSFGGFRASLEKRI